VHCGEISDNRWPFAICVVFKMQRVKLYKHNMAVLDEQTILEPKCYFSYHHVNLKVGLNLKVSISSSKAYF